jgi:hypothetical protein
MTEADWRTADAPRPMLALWGDPPMVLATPRQRPLFACAACRRGD